MSTAAQPVPAEPPAPKHPIAFVFHFAFKVRGLNACGFVCFAENLLLGCCNTGNKMGQWESSTLDLTKERTFPCAAVQVAALVFYILCETINKNQFVLNFVVCIVLLAMDFWTVSVAHPTPANLPACSTPPPAVHEPASVVLLEDISALHLSSSSSGSSISPVVWRFF